jgi:hypothetical protein
MVTSPSEQHKTFFLKPKKNKKTKKTFFNPESETDPDLKPTFAGKTEPDPDRSQKVKPAGPGSNIF